MFTGKVYGVASTVFSAATVGAAVAPSAKVPLTTVPFVGPVPLFAVAVGVLTAFLVRVVVGQQDKQKLWSYNLAVTLLAAIGAATFIIDHQVGPGNSFWVGGSFGAAGATTVSVMRSKIFIAIVDGIKAGLMRGMSAPPTDDGEKSE